MIEIKPLLRKFLPDNLNIQTWDDLKPYADNLIEREIASLDDYQRFLEDHSELNSVVNEEGSWRSIKKSCNTADKELEQSYMDFNEKIVPFFSEYDDGFNKKILESPFASQVTEAGFGIALQNMQTARELYRVENIAIETEISQKVSDANKLRGARTVVLDGEEMTIQKAADRLFLQDRTKREEAWIASRTRSYQDKEKLDEIFDDLVRMRHQTALNAGFKDYRDYRFKLLGRVDYTADDCREFNDAIREMIMPLVAKINKRQCEKLGLEKIRPWDAAVDTEGKPPIKAFQNAEDLINKTKIVFGKLHPDFSDTIQLMQDVNRIDAESRMNKRPGGFMSSLDETKIPFIFANVTQKARDVVTMIHEGGHSIHEIEKKDLRLNMYGNYPTEVAELASMSMELMTMGHWDVFFENKEECIRAKREHLEGIIELFPSVAMIDELQHEIYLNPHMSSEERHQSWSNIQKNFSTNTTDWSGFEDFKRTSWQNVHHISSYPFYYIEYAMAQMGALQMWRNYKQDPEKTIEQYKAALSLGYTKSIPEIYETAGIKFNFGKAMLKDLIQFVQTELEALDNPSTIQSPKGPIVN